jgi:hypothetical protein
MLSASGTAIAFSVFLRSMKSGGASRAPVIGQAAAGLVQKLMDAEA